MSGKTIKSKLGCSEAERIAGEIIHGNISFTSAVEMIENYGKNYRKQTDIDLFEEMSNSLKPSSSEFPTSLGEKYAFDISIAVNRVGKNHDKIMTELSEKIGVGDYNIINGFIKYLCQNNINITQQTLSGDYQLFQLSNLYK